jgi:hypothetical protein
MEVNEYAESWDRQGPLTSARPGLLRADLSVPHLPDRLPPGQTIHLTVTARNTGDTTWLAQPRDNGGYVTLGIKLAAANGLVISDLLGRTPLREDVPPGVRTHIGVTFRLPEVIPPGPYTLRFDMVDEQMFWFEQSGSPVTTRGLVIDQADGAAKNDAQGEQGACPGFTFIPAANHIALTRTAGTALAGMGLWDPSARLLEPIARAIHGLSR